MTFLSVKQTCNTFENETEQSNNKLNYKPQEPSDDFEDGLHQKFNKNPYVKY